MIDSERISALVEYLADYPEYLVVALLPEDAAAVDLGDTDVFVKVTVACNDCGAQKEVNALLDDGGCECE